MDGLDGDEYEVFNIVPCWMWWPDQRLDCNTKFENGHWYWHWKRLGEHHLPLQSILKNIKEIIFHCEWFNVEVPLYITLKYK